MIIILSGQTDPNLLPVFDEKYKPSELVIVATKLAKISAFRSALAQHVKVSDSSIINIEDPYSIAETSLKITHKLKDLIQAGKSVLINITGGTKLMSIGAYEAWKKNASDTVRAIYVDISSYHILEFTGIDSKGLPVTEIKENECNLDLKTYFAARDIKFIKADKYRNQKLENLSKSYICKVLQLHEAQRNFVNYVNQLVSRSTSKPGKHAIPTILQKSQAEGIDELLHDFIEKNLIKLDCKPGTNTGTIAMSMTSDNVDIMDVIGGKWFEDYCYNTVKKIIPVSTCEENSKIIHKNGVRNEFDVMFFYKCTLYVIEAKTNSWDKKNTTQNILHKLSSLGKDIGGKTKLGIVSYYDFPDFIQKRAKDLNIQIISGANVWNENNFIQELKNWIGIKD